jgi:hypothetical protein
MATRNCQNDEILLAIANKVGRKAYFMGLDLDFNCHWYSPVERDAFVVGWLEAEESSWQRLAATTLSTGNCFLVN